MEGELGRQTILVGNECGEGNGEGNWESSRKCSWDNRAHIPFVSQAGSVVGDAFVVHRIVAGDFTLVTVVLAITRAGGQGSRGSDRISGTLRSRLRHEEMGWMLMLRAEE